VQVFVILDEYFLAGEVMETSKAQVLTRPQPFMHHLEAQASASNDAAFA
jgi:hypothetical protein